MVAEDETGIAVPLPDTLLLLNSNDRHNRWRYNTLFQAIKMAAYITARNHKVPHFQRITFVGLLNVPDNRHRDPHNWQDSAKAAIDGLVKVGVIPDDDSEHLLDFSMRAGETSSPRLSPTLVITPVAE